MATKDEMAKRFRVAKSFNPTGGGRQARQVGQGPGAHGGYSPDYQKSKYAQRDAGLTGSNSAPSFSAPGFKGKAKKARIHSQRVQYERERRGAADRLNEIGARGQNQRAITGMQQRGQTQRQQAGFVQALQEQQSRFGQRNQEQQARFDQQNKLAGIQRQQALQDQYASSLGMKPTDRAKIFADTQDMYDTQKSMFEAENKGTPFPSQADWLQSSGILQQENSRSDYLQSLINPQQQEAGRGTVTMGGRTSSLTEMNPDVQSLFQGVQPQIQRTTQKPLGQILEELSKSSTFTKTGGSF